jgi:hypothetical protein
VKTRKLAARIFEQGTDISTAELLRTNPAEVFFDGNPQISARSEPQASLTVGQYTLRIVDPDRQGHFRHSAVVQTKQAFALRRKPQSTVPAGPEGVDCGFCKSAFNAKALESPRLETRETAAARADPEIALVILKDEPGA